MLRQTMDRLKRNASNSSVGVVSNPNISKQSFHSNRHLNSFSPFNNQDSRLASNASTPFLQTQSPSNTLKQLLKQDGLSKRLVNHEIIVNSKQLKHHAPSSFKKNLTTQHDTNKRVISTNPQSQHSSKKISEQKRLNLQKIRTITPFQSFSDRSPNAQINKQQISDAQSVVEINALKSKLSQSFSQKLEIEMKLTRSEQHNRLLQNQIISLKQQIKNLLSNHPSSINSHSFTLTNQNEYIVQLLEEYQQMKLMIQKLIKDNQELIKKNDKLKSQQTLLTSDASMKQDLDKFKQFRNANNQLMQQLNELRQRSTIENQKKTEQISKLKAALKQKHNDLKKTEQFTNLLNDKNNEITQLKHQETQMNNKIKQVLSELTNFAEKFQKEKIALVKGHEEYKVKTNSQILHLQNIIFRDSKTSNLATVGNIIHIEESLDLNQGCIDAISGDLDADFSLQSEVLASMTSDIKNMTNMLTINIREPTD